jgi:hypothetical protein
VTPPRGFSEEEWTALEMEYTQLSFEFDAMGTSTSLVRSERRHSWVVGQFGVAQPLTD